MGGQESSNCFASLENVNELDLSDWDGSGRSRVYANVQICSKTKIK